MPAIEFRLWFEHKQLPQLSKIEFTHPLLTEPITALRAGRALYDDATLAFQWSKAVRALAVLLLRVAEHTQSSQSATRARKIGAEYYLAGAEGSLASALDFALSKRPAWLSMLGVDSKGHSLAGRLFVRANPNRKHAGQVVIGPCKALLEPGSVAIWLCGRQLHQVEQLRQLRVQCESHPQPRPCSVFVKERGQAAEPQRGSESCSSAAQEILLAECRRGLNDLEVFSEPAESEKLQRQLADPSYLAFAGRNAAELSRACPRLSPGERLGWLSAEHCAALQVLRAATLDAAAPITSPASAFVLDALGRLLGTRFRLKATYPHAVQILRELTTQQIEPDFLVLGIAPSAKLLAQRSCQYQPLLFLPSLQHQVLAHQCCGQSYTLDGEFHLLEDSTAYFMYEQLQRQGGLSHQRSKLTFSEPWKSFQGLREKDGAARVISFFPYASLALRQLPVQAHTSQRASSGKEMLLLLHQRWARDLALQRSLNVALRHCWQNLRSAAHFSGAGIEDFCRRQQLVRAVRQISL
jgi:hypothetical protein